MNKQTFALYISENMQISDMQADMIIDVFTSNLAQAIFEGEPVDLEDFGAFIPSTKLETTTSHNDIMFIAGRLLKNNFVSQ